MKRALAVSALAAAALAGAAFVGAALAQPQAQEAPGPAPGKWRITVTAMGAAMPAQEQCITRQMTMAEAQQSQQQAGVTCSEQHFTRTAGGMTGHSVCTTNGMTITSDFTITGDLTRAYTMEMNARMSPPPTPSMSEMRMTAQAERIGDC